MAGICIIMHFRSFDLAKANGVLNIDSGYHCFQWQPCSLYTRENNKEPAGLIMDTILDYGVLSHILFAAERVHCPLACLLTGNFYGIEIENADGGS